MMTVAIFCCIRTIYEIYIRITVYGLRLGSFFNGPWLGELYHLQTCHFVAERDTAISITIRPVVQLYPRRLMNHGALRNFPGDQKMRCRLFQQSRSNCTVGFIIVGPMIYSAVRYIQRIRTHLILHFDLMKHSNHSYRCTSPCAICSAAYRGIQISVWHVLTLGQYTETLKLKERRITCMINDPALF